MKQFLLLLLSLSLITTFVNAQSDDKALENNKAYAGAKASLDMYHAIYQLDNNDPKIIERPLGVSIMY
jgi:hypothetical protein